MSGSIASASADPSTRTVRRDLVISVNWIGDAIMAMPALQLYRRLHPDRYIAVLARGVIADLWNMHAAPDEVIRYDQRPGFFSPLFDDLRNRYFDQAWILPNSFRSAWMAFRSGIARRSAMAGGWRRPLLNDVPERKVSQNRLHQSWEYIELMARDYKLDQIPRPELAMETSQIHEIQSRMKSWSLPAIGMIPGAARGPSKRWPAGHFEALALKMARDQYHIVLFGGHDDAPICDELVKRIGAQATSLAGRTSLLEWAAMMKSCDLIVANDSGGMHLAAALGVPVVALYGMTDPGRTGPIGDRCTVIQHSRRRSRDIARNSVEAEKSLASIQPEEVYLAVKAML
ncbi:MAG TPA: lipopolysaccharide heptosyltransferase II [Kiritimatiellia bacterium]|mgnify:CR=1 FL=1|nr:lipopolysaccharide heptosyltransferase II [Kiritimatiellia bacterium]